MWLNVSFCILVNEEFCFSIEGIMKEKAKVLETTLEEVTLDVTLPIFMVLGRRWIVLNNLLIIARKNRSVCATEYQII